MSTANDWVVGYYLSNGDVAVISGSPRFPCEEYAAAEASRRNREKPFIAHIAVRSDGPSFNRTKAQNA